MSFCTNCGNVLDKEAKFCANCGAPQKNTSTKKNTPREIPKENHSIIVNDLGNRQISENESRKKWLLVYVVVNILFVLFNPGSNEIKGILIFSVAIFLMYSIRRKKEKPFNIILKILLVLQSILVFSTIMEGLEYVASSAYSLIVFACLAILIVVDIKLILNGNKT